MVKSKDVDIVILVFLNDSSCIFIRVERVHEDERDVDIVFGVQVLIPEPVNLAPACRMEEEKEKEKEKKKRSLRFA